MNDSRRDWAPKTVRSKEALLLLVDRGRLPLGTARPKMTAALLRELVAAKLQAMVAAEGLEALGQALEASEEHLPDLAAVKADLPQEEWLTALLSSDRMAAALSLGQWEKETGPGRQELTQPELRELLQEQTLAEVVERL